MLEIWRELGQLDHTQTREVLPSSDVVSFDAEALLLGEKVKAKIRVYNQRDLPEGPGYTRNNVRFLGEPDMSAEDIRDLDTEDTRSFNILFKPYRTSESVVFYPDSQRQALLVSEAVKRSGMAGELKSGYPPYESRDIAFRTQTDVFWYEFEGTAWDVRPKRVTNWDKLRKRVALPSGSKDLVRSSGVVFTSSKGKADEFTEGVPARKDMQAWVNRAPDYRIPPNLVRVYLTYFSEAQRVQAFVRALDKFSSGMVSVSSISESKS